MGEYQELRAQIERRIDRLERDRESNLDEGLDPECYNVACFDGAIHELRKLLSWPN